MRWWIGLTAAMIAVPAAGATLQQDYEAAAQALQADDAAGAAAKFEALLARLPKAALANPNNATAALVRAGLGRALTSLGRSREALPLLKAAIPLLPVRTPDERMNLAEVLMDLGRNHERLADYPAARDAFQRALALDAYPASDPGTLRAQIGLTRVSIFDAPDVALRTSDAILPIARDLLAQTKPDKAKLARDQLGEIYSLRGRIHLNRGEYGVARSWFDQALKAAGGLGTTISVSDVRIRGDLAIIHHLLGNEDKVRLYLGYTGSARGDAMLDLGADTPLPVCGEATGLQPDDMAIVEFGITDDGRVTGAVPIFAKRPQAAAEFVRAVNQWSWRPETVAKLNAFWRAAVRLELRCRVGGDRPNLASTLAPSVQRWQDAKGIGISGLADRTAAEAVPLLRAELVRREAKYGLGAPELLPVLTALASSELVSYRDAAVIFERASRIAWASDVPDEVRVATDLGFATTAARGAPDRRRYAEGRRTHLVAALDRLRAAGRDGTRAAALLRFEIAGTYEVDQAASAETVYRDIVAMPASTLGENDAIRQAALLQLASLVAARRDTVEAARLVAATGLSAEQCALTDVRPMQVGGRVTTNDFPDDALRWMFEGWVQVSYDIGTDGRALAPRAVMAYPPFVFSDSTARAIGRFRFQPLPRPSGNIGCTGRQQTVRYLIPD